MNSLKTLDLMDNKIDFIPELANLASIERIYLINNLFPLDGQNLAHIAKLPSSKHKKRKVELFG